MINFKKRKIEFRVWFQKEKVMINNISNVIDTYSSCIHTKDKSFSYEDDNGIFLQFTGAMDFKNRPIFEGDIISYTHGLEGYPSTQFQHIGVVEFKNGCFNILHDPDNFNFEILGNVFENPDLLKEEK